MTVIETDRLRLLPTHPDLFEGLWSAVESSVAELRAWMPWAIEPDRDATLTFVRHAAAEWADGHERHFTLTFEGEVYGQCSLDHPDPLHSNYEMGYWLRSDLCNQGLTSEAASAVVAFAFDDLAAHRIELHAGVGNKASIRVAEKLNFQREGVLREAGRGADGFYDSYVYGLLASDSRPQ